MAEKLIVSKDSHPEIHKALIEAGNKPKVFSISAPTKNREQRRKESKKKRRN